MRSSVPMSATARLGVAAAAAAALSSACALHGPATMAPGSSVAAVAERMGKPTGEYPLAVGGRRLEYAGGTFGRQTFMFDFDANGRLLRAEQVLTERRFNAIQAGMTSAEVLEQIGKPSTTFTVRREPQTTWGYRFENPFCQWFMVGLDRDGRVGEAAYGPDPLCDFMKL